jgi:hypothetical protein
MKAANYDSSVGAVSIIQSKTGKKKDIFLTPDEAEVFDKHIHGKKQDELRFSSWEILGADRLFTTPRSY